MLPKLHSVLQSFTQDYEISALVVHTGSRKENTALEYKRKPNSNVPASKMFLSRWRPSDH